MVQVAWSTSNLKVYTARDGSATVCESCCDSMYGEGCYLCDAGKTPLLITVNIISGSNRVCYPPNNYTSVGIIETLIGSHVVPQYNDIIYGYCVWQKTWDGNYGTTTACGGGPPTANWTKLRLRILHLAPFNQLYIQLNSGAGWYSIGRYEWADGDRTGCMNCVQNTYTYDGLENIVISIDEFDTT